jgi:hypothetical protein
MKKLLIKIAVLSCLTLVGLSFTDDMFRDQHFFKETINILNSKDDFDILILGSSKAHSAYDPRIFEAVLGLKTINLGAPAQKFEATQAAASHALKKHTPKFIIVDILSLGISPYYNQKNRTDQLATFNQLPFSIEKSKKLLQVFGAKEVANTIWTTTRNHSDWNLVFGGSYQKAAVFNGIDYYNGFRSYFRRISTKEWAQFLKNNQGKNQLKREVNLTAEEINKIEDLIKVLSGRNSEVVFVNSPSYFIDIDARLREHTKRIKEYLEFKEYHYLDINQLRDSIGLNKTHFSDPNHLNSQGAGIMSESLALFLKDKFELKPYKLPAAYLNNNRYYHLADAFNNAHLNKKIINGQTINKAAPSNLFLVKSSKNRMDLIVKIKDTVNINLEVQLHYDNTRLRPLLEQANIITQDSLFYAVYPFNYSKEIIDSLEVFLGNPPQKVLSINHSQLN